MTQQEKQLLLKDLCARLPYGVKMRTWYNDTITSDINTFPYGIDETPDEQLAGCKPYLRPMSSMTEEEKIELCVLSYVPDEAKTMEEKMNVVRTNADNATDWLNAHHFDYRGLIPMGLALEATEGMYKIK